VSGETLPDSDRAASAESAGGPAPDVEAIVAELEREVERKRSAGAYPAALLERLHTAFHADEGLEPPEVSVLVESARPIRSTHPVVGPAIVFGKRVARRLLAWYVAPIAKDQTRFNLAILRELRALERRVKQLEGAAAPGAGPPTPAGALPAPAGAPTAPVGAPPAPVGAPPAPVGAPPAPVGAPTAPVPDPPVRGSRPRTRR
jgi:hypothetical protein